MMTLSDCVISGEDVGLIKAHVSAVVSILGKYGIKLEEFCDSAVEKKDNSGDRPASVEYSGCEFVTIRQMAELIFEWYHCEEDQKTMVGFITSRLKSRKYLTYHQTASGRAYNCGDNVTVDGPKWLMVPARCRADHTRDFYSQDLHFIKDSMSSMMYDLWIGNEDYFTKNLNSYKEYKAQFRKGGN